MFVKIPRSVNYHGVCFLYTETVRFQSEIPTYSGHGKKLQVKMILFAVMVEDCDDRSYLAQRKETTRSLMTIRGKSKA